MSHSRAFDFRHDASRRAFDARQKLLEARLAYRDTILSLNNNNAGRFCPLSLDTLQSIHASNSLINEQPR